MPIKKINAFWIPACTGMTEMRCSRAYCISLLVAAAPAGGRIPMENQLRSMRWRAP